jgi:hypothetical protein
MRTSVSLGGIVGTLRMTRATVLLFGLLLGVGCSREDSRGRCERLRDHLADLRLAQSAGVDEAAHREAMKAALGDDFLSRCASKLGSREIDCALKATDAAAAAACSAVAAR